MPDPRDGSHVCQGCKAKLCEEDVRRKDGKKSSCWRCGSLDIRDVRVDVLPNRMVGNYYVVGLPDGTTMKMPLFGTDTFKSDLKINVHPCESILINGRFF